MKLRHWSRSSVMPSGKLVNRRKRFRQEFERSRKMLTQEFSREQWTNFFNSFNRQHEGWLATLEVFATEAGAQEEARDRCSEGISVDAKEGEAAAALISVGKTPAEHVSNKIE